MKNLSEIQVSREALVHNAAVFRKLRPNAPMIAVVKGNAYGHGMAEVVSCLESHVDGFQVDDIDELRDLRKLTGKSAYVFGYVPKDSLEEALSLDAELAIYDQDRVETLGQHARRSGKSARVHLKVDAILGRQGVMPAELSALLGTLSKYPELEVASVYAHYANIEDTTDLSHAELQRESFLEMAVRVKAKYPNANCHIAATSGAITIEADTTELARIGIGMYGLYPSAALERSHSSLGLKPVMRWVSHLAQVKTLPARHPVGYGLTFITHRETRLGIVPQGYADGYDRGLSNTGEVLVQGKRCPVLGRVAMNMFAVDLTDLGQVSQEDEVVLLGAQGNERISAEEIAVKIGTINYEVTTRVTPLLPRIIV